jgi:hypothetical protein
MSDFGSQTGAKGLAQLARGTRHEGIQRTMATDLRRFEVFVSSTYSDLSAERQSVTMTLLECDAFPTGMEIFPATDDDAWTLIRRVIDGCDYYLLVIAGKYGSVDPTSGLSYTEMEYDYAVSADKPVMAFLHGNPGQLTSGQCEDTDERRAKLENFREKVKKAKHVKFWKSADDLAGQVSRTYNKFVRLYPATGWVRADQASSAESLKELLATKARIEELEAELEKAKRSAPTGAEGLAQGNDEFEVEYRVSAGIRVGGPLREIGAHMVNKPTWDGLFAAIAPYMLQESEERVVRARIDAFLLLEFYDDNLSSLIEEAKEVLKPRSALTASNFEKWKAEISGSAFGTVLVQLTALGLIQRSEHKRSVSDTGRYWSLTPYGESRTVQLRAIKRSVAIGSAPASAGVE